MYIRFRIAEKHHLSGRPLGLFGAIYDLQSAGQISAPELERSRALVGWFGDELPVPTRLSKSSKTHATPVALSWFKDSATKHISKMRDIASILEEHGVRVRMLTTKKPGYIVYEDDFQVAAQPFPDTPV